MESEKEMKDLTYYQRKELEKYKNGANPDKKYAPVMCSSKVFTFHESEKIIIDRLREWAYDYFRTTYVYDTETHVNFKEFQSIDGTLYYRDFDFLGKLVDVEWIDD